MPDPRRKRWGDFHTDEVISLILDDLDEGDARSDAIEAKQTVIYRIAVGAILSLTGSLALLVIERLGSGEP